MTTQPQAAPRSTRREFLKSAGTVGAVALTIGFEWAGTARRAFAGPVAPSAGAAFAPNAFLRIGSDNSVTVIAKHVEMGQGAYTGIATVLAEELDADWAQVRVESAPADAARYANLAFGKIQGTGGSSAMANSWMQLREAGGKARVMLLTAAAKQWKVPLAELTVEQGTVYHAGSKRQAKFGALVATAATLPVPEAVILKDPKDFKLIGHHAPRVDASAKSDGTAQFTLDVMLPGMLVALLKRPPQFGATVKSFDAAAAGAVPGVVKVVAVPRGVAVVAKSFWAAKLGRDALQIEWDDSKAEKRSSSAIMEEYRRLADQPALSGHPERGPQVIGQLRVPVLGARADGTARCGHQAQRQQLRDLGGRPIPNDRSGERRAHGGVGSAASKHSHALRRRQLRPARQPGFRLHRRSRVHRQGVRRRRHADQAAVDA